MFKEEQKVSEPFIFNIPPPNLQQNMLSSQSNNMNLNALPTNINHYPPQKHLNIGKRNNISVPQKDYQFNLEHVIGISSNSKNSLIFNPINGDLVYPAGSLIVHYNVAQNAQKQYFTSKNKQSVMSLAFSWDGKYLASGQSSGKSPEISIWSMHSNETLYPSLGSLGHIASEPLKQLRGHQYGIAMLHFSPNNKYLVSIGDSNDKGLFVWDHEKEVKLTLNKLSQPCNSACFSNDSQRFAICGPNHIQYWYFDSRGEIIMVKAKEREDAYIMEGQSVILSPKFAQKNYVDCQFSIDGTNLYVLSQDGALCMLNEARVIEKWMDLKISRAFSLQVSLEIIVCGCSDGIIRVFQTNSLDHLTTLPKPPSLLNYNVEQGVTKLQPSQPGHGYADCVAVAYDHINAQLASLYSDKTLFIWDFKKLDKIQVKRSFLNHSAGIQDLQILQSMSSYEVSFVASASNDQTVRIWHLIDDQDGGIGGAGDGGGQQSYDISNILGIRRNVYAKNLSRIVYLSQDSDHFKADGGAGGNLQESSIVDGKLSDEALQQKAQEEMEQLKKLNQDQVRCLKFSTDGQFLATGDMEGTLRIYFMKTFELIESIDAHEQEICCIDFTPENKDNINLMATGSRDRLIHIYNLEKKFSLLTTLDDHNASIIAVKFSYSQETEKLYLVTCGADKSLVFREYVGLNNNINKFRNPQNAYQINSDVHPQVFHTFHSEIDKNNKIFSLEIDPEAALGYAAQEKKISTFSVVTGKAIANKTFEVKEEDKNSGQLIPLDHYKTNMEPSGCYLASVCSDQTVRIINVANGLTVGKLNCGDATTGLVFTMNGKHLITATSEGCIFVWRVPNQMKQNIDQKQQQIGVFGKRLQELVAAQDMQMSQQWTINSFWIEDELQKYIHNNQAPNAIPKEPNNHVLGGSVSRNSVKPTFPNNMEKNENENLNRLLNKENQASTANVNQSNGGDDIVGQIIYAPPNLDENSLIPGNLVRNSVLPDWAQSQIGETQIETSKNITTLLEQSKKQYESSQQVQQEPLKHGGTSNLFTNNESGQVSTKQDTPYIESDVKLSQKQQMKQKILKKFKQKFNEGSINPFAEDSEEDDDEDDDTEQEESKLRKNKFAPKNTQKHDNDDIDLEIDDEILLEDFHNFKKQGTENQNNRNSISKMFRSRAVGEVNQQASGIKFIDNGAEVPSNERGIQLEFETQGGLTESIRGEQEIQIEISGGDCFRNTHVKQAHKRLSSKERENSQRERPEFDRGEVQNAIDRVNIDMNQIQDKLNSDVGQPKSISSLSIQKHGMLGGGLGVSGHSNQTPNKRIENDSLKISPNIGEAGGKRPMLIRPNKIVQHLNSNENQQNMDIEAMIGKVQGILFNNNNNRKSANTTPKRDEENQRDSSKGHQKPVVLNNEQQYSNRVENQGITSNNSSYVSRLGRKEQFLEENVSSKFNNFQNPQQDLIFKNTNQLENTIKFSDDQDENGEAQNQIEQQVEDEEDRNLQLSDIQDDDDEVQELNNLNRRSMKNEEIYLMEVNQNDNEPENQQVKLPSEKSTQSVAPSQVPNENTKENQEWPNPQNNYLLPPQSNRNLNQNNNHSLPNNNNLGNNYNSPLSYSNNPIGNNFSINNYTSYNNNSSTTNSHNNSTPKVMDSESRFEESRVIQNNDQTNFSSDYELQMQNSFAVIFNEINQLQNMMHVVQAEKDDSAYKSRIFQTFNENMLKTKNSMTALNMRASQINPMASLVDFGQNPTNSSQVLNDVLIGASRDLLENYSKMLIEAIKNNIIKENSIQK